MATAIGSLLTRTIIAKAIRRIGFRALLIWSASLTSLFYISYGLFTPSTPHLGIFVVLVMGGLCNSLAMVSLNTLGFSQVPREVMSHATAASTMAQQLSVCLGVVLGASLLGAISGWHGRSPTILQSQDFTLAFLTVGSISMLSVLWFRKLKPEEGSDLR